MSEILGYVKTERQRIFETLEKYVKAESPSDRKDLVDRCGRVLQDIVFELLDGKGEVYAQTDTGDHLKFTYGDGDGQILILCHMDTVWEKGRIPFRVEGNRAYGPGILDMKGGGIQAIWAVKALKDLGRKADKKIVLLFNSDEEIGSPSSRRIIEEEAKKSEYVLVPEAATDDGSLKTARKGIGNVNLKIRGVAAHAGNDHEKGTSAIEELAHQIIYLNGLTDYSIGTTLNVGVVKGGTRSNVIPDYAEAHIDFRVETLAEAKRLECLMNGLKPRIRGTVIEAEGKLSRPPMERTASTIKMFEIAKRIGKELGMELTEKSVGGGSDGNFTAALGIPTLDGLGAVGAGAHAEHEHIRIDEIPARTALLAHLLLEL